MGDEKHVQSVYPIPIRANLCFEQILRALGGNVRRDQPNSAGDTMDMGVDGYRRHAKREEQNARSCFRTNAGQSSQPVSCLVN
jgi:hypothetical protein